MSIHILFGSETGNAQNLATQAGEFFKDTTILDLENVSVTDLKSFQNILIITSTWGDGEIPSNATKFYEDLESSKESLVGTAYAVFGIGSSAFPMFCQAAINFDESLSRLGAKQLTELVKSDNSYQDDFKRWLDSLSKVLN